MKNKKLIFFAILLVIIAITAFAASADTIVYITKSGTMYHRANCTSLKQSKIETTLGAAVKKGFGRCSKCNPPALDAEQPKETKEKEFADIIEQ